MIHFENVVLPVVDLCLCTKPVNSPTTVVILWPGSMILRSINFTIAAWKYMYIQVTNVLLFYDMSSP